MLGPMRRTIPRIILHRPAALTSRSTQSAQVPAQPPEYLLNGRAGGGRESGSKDTLTESLRPGPFQGICHIRSVPALAVGRQDRSTTSGRPAGLMRQARSVSAPRPLESFLVRLNVFLFFPLLFLLVSSRFLKHAVHILLFPHLTSAFTIRSLLGPMPEREAASLFVRDRIEPMSKCLGQQPIA